VQDEADARRSISINFLSPPTPLSRGWRSEGWRVVPSLVLSSARHEFMRRERRRATTRSRRRYRGELIAH